MSKSNKNLKYLSQSVLLEEVGLPHLDTIIILLVTLVLAAFIGWATVMPIDEVVSVKGTVVSSDYSSDLYRFMAQIPSSKINSVAVGNAIVLNIPGVTDKNPILGTMKEVGNTSNLDEQGKVYYLAEVAPSQLPSSLGKLMKGLHPGMEIQVDIVVGSKTLIEYFIGPIFNIKSNAFNEQ